ncbi:unnamed protein product [Amoebophrya sp. A120]|nr:unnamed protein product [Amoebophrya sp. A120]|eukprot:GSA120T00016069001.1
MTMSEQEQLPGAPADADATAPQQLVSKKEKQVAVYDACDSKLQSSFQSFGELVARHPWKFIVGTIFFTILFAAGQYPVQKYRTRSNCISQAETEERPERLWIPEDAQALDDVDWVDAQWPALTRANLALTRCTGCNMLTKANLDLLWRKYYLIQRIEVDGDFVRNKFTDKYSKAGPWDKYTGTYVFDFTNDFPDTATRSRRCKLNQGNCQRRDVFDLLGADYNNENWFNNQTDASILAALNAYTPQSRVNSVLGAVTRDPTTSNILAAELVSSMWEIEIDSFYDENDGNRRKQPIALLWEREALCYLGINANKDRDKLKDEATGCEANKLPGLETRAYFGRSISDEFSRTIGGDQMLIGIAIFLIIIYLVAMLGKRDSVHSMIALSWGSVLSVMLACSAGLGLAYWFGVKDCVLRFNIYFLILGLGVDDAFVLVSEYNRVMKIHPDFTLEEKIGKIVKYGGMSILVTSLTDAVAFFIAATSSVPALRYFCFYAAFSVTFCFLFQLTFFVPCLAINAQRAGHNRLDCFCCCKAESEHPFDKPTGFCSNSVPGCKSEPMLPKLLTFNVRMLLTTPGKIFAFVIFTIFMSLSAVGLAKQKADFQLEWFFPEDSYVVDYFDWSDAYFSQGTRASIYIRNPSTAFTQQTMKDCLTNVENYMQTSKYFDQAQMRDSWVKKVTAFSATSTLTAFYDQVKAWETSTYGASGTAEDFTWVNAAVPSSGFQAVRVSNGILRKQYINEGTDRWDTMEALRSEVPNLCAGGNSFPFGFEFLWWEEVGYTGPEFVRNALLCSGVILAIILCMIPSFRANIPVIISVLSTILNVVGFYYWLGEPINGVISIYTVICIGLSVDYSAHIGHMFRHSVESTGNKKAIDAVNRIGISVLNALLSTLLAVIVLAFSASYVFSVFFKVLVLVVLFGFINSLIILPVLLSVFNGGACENGVEPEEAVKIMDIRVSSKEATSMQLSKASVVLEDAGAAKAGAVEESQKY